MRIEELRVPATLDDGAGAAAFADAVGVANAAEAAALGTRDFTHTPAEVLPGWLDLEKEPKRLFVVRLDERIVARGTIEWRDTEARSDFVWQDLHVHPDVASRGIGTALADHLEERARAAGKRWVIVRVNSAFGRGPQLEAPTGFGSVPATHREVRFLVNRGFELRQVNRISRLPLPADRDLLEEQRAIADGKAGSDYRIVHWMDQTPPEWQDQMVVLMPRLEQDLPLAGVPFPDTADPAVVWSAERIRQREELELERGNHQLFGAAVHLPTGTLAGFTVLILPRDTSHLVKQDTTFVLGEHRGHRLSMLLKIANIQELERMRTGHPGIATENAEDNRFMLDVNEALRFEPLFANGTWMKELR